MGFLNSRKGELSIFRVGVFFAVIGLAIIGGGLLIFSLEQASRRQPLDVALPPETSLLASETLSINSRRQYFASNLPAEEVAAFFDQRLAEFTGSSASDTNRETCVREPRSGNYPNYQPGNGVIPYKYTCLFDSPSFGVDQFTTVLIHPDVAESASDEAAMTTRIEYDQYWQP